jgi:hypothetical protein
MHATGHVPGDQLRAAFDAMEAAWADVVQAGEAADRVCKVTCRCGGPRRKPAKDSFNCWVGTCGMSAEVVNIKPSLSFEPKSCAKRQRDAYGIPGLWEYATYTRVLDSGSYFLPKRLSSSV